MLKCRMLYYLRRCYHCCPELETAFTGRFMVYAISYGRNFPLLFHEIHINALEYNEKILELFGKPCPQ